MHWDKLRQVFSLEHIVQEEDLSFIYLKRPKFQLSQIQKLRIEMKKQNSFSILSNKREQETTINLELIHHLMNQINQESSIQSKHSFRGIATWDTNDAPFQVG